MLIPHLWPKTWSSEPSSCIRQEGLWCLTWEKSEGEVSRSPNSVLPGATGTGLGGGCVFAPSTPYFQRLSPPG